MATNNYLDERIATNALVYVDGKPINYMSLEVTQAFGEHHRFSIKMDYDSLGGRFMSDPLGRFDLIGRFVEIELQQGQDNANAYEFLGVISDVGKLGEEGMHGSLLLEGFSATILLERGKRMDVFCEMTLRDVVREVTSGIINKSLPVFNNPAYTGKIGFLMQYDESDWEFLQRLSAISGETLFYTGRDLVFGKYTDWPCFEVTYDKEISLLRLGARLQANHYTGFQYFPIFNEWISQDTPQRIEDANDFVNMAYLRSRELTEKRPVRTPLAMNVEDQGSLHEMLVRSKVSTASQTVYVKGVCKTCAPRIGRLLKINMPMNMPDACHPGTYRITKVRHVIDQGSRYRCEFEGIPSELRHFPLPELKMPLVGTLLGEVVKNNDPEEMGRVCVEFPFATDRVSESWIRVMSPGAGASSEVPRNRGLVFVPEVGDQVMVGFEYGDPNRPYVMGSMFHGRNSAGGGPDNHLKSIVTRSGLTLEFDDSNETKGITLKDKNGNCIHIDTKGNHIEITARETMTLNAHNLIVNVDENMEVNVGKDMLESVGGNLSSDVGEDSAITTTNVNLNISGSSIIDIGEKLDLLAAEADIRTGNGDFTVQSAGVALIQGEEDARISKS